VVFSYFFCCWHPAFKIKINFNKGLLEASIKAKVLLIADLAAFWLTFSSALILFEKLSMERSREFKNKEKIETSTRFSISFLIYKPAQFQYIIRSHWAIENKLHWTLLLQKIMIEKEVENAVQNFSLINKIVLNLVKNETSCKLGIKSKRKIAGWDENYLLKILGF